MQLCYRGVTYDRQNVSILTAETGDSAQFLGGNYLVCRPVIDLEVRDRSFSCYLGDSNQKQFQGRFLGQIYSSERLAVATV